MDLTVFWNEILKRWSAEKPAFFKKLQEISLYVLVVAGVPTFAMENGLDLPIPQWLTASLSMLSAAAALISQFTVTSAEKIRLKLLD